VNLLTWLGFKADGKPLETGARAPDAIVFDVHGSELHLARFYWDGFTLIYFYPKAATPGCTKQACGMRDKFDELKARNVDVLGISTDAPGAAKRFQEAHQLPFILLADPEYHAAQAFGVPLLVGMTRRMSFLVRGGKIVWRDLNPKTGRHAREVLAAVEKLAPTESGS
jgi:peroxiredoxin Q/BCP